jgi:hypothetical protein
MNHVNQPANQPGAREGALRFSNLATCICAGLYGLNDNDVQAMVQRNITIDSERAFNVQFSKQEKEA